MDDTGSWDFWIDVGGTFTDCIARDPIGSRKRFKLLSSGVVPGECAIASTNSIAVDRDDPDDVWAGYQITVFSDEGRFDSRIRTNSHGCIELESNLPWSDTRSLRFEIRSDEEAPTVAIRYLVGVGRRGSLPPIRLRLGTTRGTNALLTRNGARTGLLITSGFRDLLEIGNQSRPRLFELSIKKPLPLYASVAEVNERMSTDGGELQEVDVERLKAVLVQWKADGVESIAVCLHNAFANPAHELQVAELAHAEGFSEVSVSSKLANVIKLVPRSQTCVLNAYLNPVLRSYIDRIRRSLPPTSDFMLMGSAGGLMESSDFQGKDSILSGPAGGVVGFASVGRATGFDRSIGFDMGGTSTDVARYDGDYEYDFEVEKAGVEIMSPTLAIETVAAGGGSICHFDGVRLLVGPQSAGAFPGPVCYGNDGPLTVTDVNVFLGRISPDLFPFPLNVDAIEAKLQEISAALESQMGKQLSLDEIAEGFRRVANTNMSAAIRSVSVAKGFDPRDYPLVCFGGAAGQHACAIADELQMRTIVVHTEAGILSALGIGLADVARHRVKGVYEPVTAEETARYQEYLNEMANELVQELTEQGYASTQIELQHSAELRFVGQDTTLQVPFTTSSEAIALFHEAHHKRYGFTYPERSVELVSLQVRASAQANQELATSHVLPDQRRPEAESLTRICHEGQFIEVPLFKREVDLEPGDLIVGPAIIAGQLSTTVVEHNWLARVMSESELLLTPQGTGELPNGAGQRRKSEQATNDLPRDGQNESSQADPVLLEVFHHHFASIAEQMGHTLRNTSSSVNIKERLDFSCALFTASGDLVVNAPHIPVHLGAMSESVKQVIADNPGMLDGDVYVTNDPFHGGSHLPDVTVVTPVFSSSGEVRFFTASRAHHAEIGGSTPGSMPPFSRCLEEEGVLIQNFKLVAGGESRIDAFEELLLSGEFPSRCPADNIADVSAQVAANRQGVVDLVALIERYGWETTSAYMQHIQSAAEIKTRRAIAGLATKHTQFADRLTNGSNIRLVMSVEGDTIHFDFTGTDMPCRDNLNANRAIVTAAILYCLRLLVDEDIPMNQGVLFPVRLTLPTCLLNPEPGTTAATSPAIVGGNVETSQRVVDIVLASLGLAAASQGTMNNFVFGNDRLAYYETICGGEGGSIHGPGASAVHTHMTNTRITDPEVFERRYPIRVRQFAIRDGSGGAGSNAGGDGIIREIEFLEPMEVSILSQRRGEDVPFGLKNGKPGLAGRNLKISAGETTELESRFQGGVQPGDRIRIETPGGGGFGM